MQTEDVLIDWAQPLPTAEPYFIYDAKAVTVGNKQWPLSISNF
jgi:hypothetical protein